MASDAQESRLKERVLPHVSPDTGRLEDQTLDLDARAMQIMGKSQQLTRNFGMVSTISFGTTVLASWQYIATGFQGGLVNGGPSALIYGYILSFAGALATAASLAELASMSPTSGGQYHWVAELAPRRYGILFSWAAGWISIWSRIAATASGCYVSGTMIQGLIVLNYEAYTYQRWHGTFLYWAIILLSIVVNILGIKFFPHIETLALVLHVACFFLLLIPLVYLAPQSSAGFVFQTFENSGGWSNNGVSWCLGLITSTYALSGIDSTCHMCEEVKRASVVVPRSMVFGMIMSGVLAFAFSIALLFGIGDLSAALSTPTQYPIIQIFKNATQSDRATNAMVAALISSTIFSNFGLLASASRLTWAFARDKGLPWSNYFSHVNTIYLIPTRAIGLITIVLAVLGLINIGSSTAFNAMLSITVVGQYTSYVLPILLITVRRFGRKEIPFGPWTLGYLGLPLNILSIAFSSLIIVFMLFPPYQPVNAENMNYASLVMGLVIVTSGLSWLAHGKKVYAGPVRDVMEKMSVKHASD